MKIRFAGAAQEVTGSKHLIKVNGHRILLDCGTYQGQRSQEYAKNLCMPILVDKLDAVILSHAHIDHSGNLPNLVKRGYKGPIYSTFATHDLCNYMLRDSAYIQEKDVEYLNKKLAKKGQEPVEPIYRLADAETALKQFQGIDYGKEFPVVPGVTATFFDAGHILGSAMVMLNIDDKETKKSYVLCYSGDLGRKGLPILRDPHQPKNADFLIVESTYGDRLHEAVSDVPGILADIVNRTANRGGKIIIPAFSLGRTQEIVYSLHLLMNKHKIPQIPIFVDSPLSGNVTEVFKGHPECFDKETYREFLDNHENPFGFNRLKYITDVKDSKALNSFQGPCIIISASGMCEHGRILHHLKNNIENDKNTVLIVGYMAQNTLGRKIIEKRKIVNIFGRPHRLRCEVAVVDAFSAHADRSDLLDFTTHIQGLKKVFLVHGEQKQIAAFQKALEKNGIKDVTAPAFAQQIEIN